MPSPSVHRLGAQSSVDDDVRAWDVGAHLSEVWSEVDVHCSSYDLLMPTESIIEKIRKLLRLAKGTKNVHEAASAAARASALMMDHKLSESDVKEAGSLIEELELNKGGFSALWRMALLAAVAEHLFCTVIRDRAGKSVSSVRLAGKPDDIAATTALYKFLLKEIQRLCDAQMPGEERSGRDAFRRGATLAVRDRLRQARKDFVAEHEKALVRFRGADDEVAGYVKNKYANAPKAGPEAPSDDRGAKLRGYVAGMGIPLPGPDGRLDKDLGTKQIGGKGS